MALLVHPFILALGTLSIRYGITSICLHSLDTQFASLDLARRYPHIILLCLGNGPCPNSTCLVIQVVIIAHPRLKVTPFLKVQFMDSTTTLAHHN
jgi:hypothetical protein